MKERIAFIWNGIRFKLNILHEGRGSGNKHKDILQNVESSNNIVSTPGTDIITRHEAEKTNNITKDEEAVAEQAYDINANKDEEECWIEDTDDCFKTLYIILPLTQSF